MYDSGLLAICINSFSQNNQPERVATSLTVSFFVLDQTAVLLSRVTWNVSSNDSAGLAVRFVEFEEFVKREIAADIAVSDDHGCTTDKSIRNWKILCWYSSEKISLRYK